MGQQQSKDELLYQQVNYGNVEGIRALFHDGASLEWIDREGKTPLIAACMNPELFNVAKTLIELGANVNGYRPGSHAGTPLHHAAKRGLEHTVNLLLSHGANAFVMNDDCQTPLDVARAKGYSNVVRVIESHICFFSGWLRELYGPGFLKALAPQWVSRKIWAVVIPGGTRNPSKPLKLELAVYPSPQDSQPRTVIALWKAKIEDLNFNQPDPTIIIFDKSSRTHYKFASANEDDKQQLQWFYNACKGLPQVMHPPLPSTTHAPLIPATAPPPSTEDVELAMAINASIQSAMVDRPPLPDTHLNTESTDANDWGNNSADNATHNSWGPTGSAPPSNAGTNEWMDGPPKESYNGWGPGTSEAGPSTNITPHTQTQDTITTAVSPSHSIPTISSSVPSAPPIPLDGIEIGPIHYPTIDMSPIDLSTPVAKEKPIGTSEVKEDEGDTSSCVICLDAPIEGACIPCGHMAGCMSCLNGIKAKKWGCPVCRAKIDQVVRLYTV